jgi:sulfur-oxidizing protein SoxY
MEDNAYVVRRDTVPKERISPGLLRRGKFLLAAQCARERTRTKRNDDMTSLSRRQVFMAGAGAFATITWGATVPAFAANDSDDLIKAFTGGKAPTEGKVKLDLPEIAENGNTVPMTVSVDSPMSEQSYVSEVLVVGDGNPRGGLATFHFTPDSGVAEANTRIRLAATQTITAIAKMNDGALFVTAKQVKVTIGGCGG